LQSSSTIKKKRKRKRKRKRKKKQGKKEKPGTKITLLPRETSPETSFEF
jgi:hypothetical protein